MEKNRMKYVLIKKFETGETAVSIIEDPLALYKNGQYNEDNGDQLFQLGEEVKVEMNIKVKSKVTYRGPESMPIVSRGSGTLVNNLSLKTEDGYNG
jgi:hypothetical protein